jgi:hypothetical protein
MRGNANWFPILENASMDFIPINSNPVSQTMFNYDRLVSNKTRVSSLRIYLKDELNPSPEGMYRCVMKPTGLRNFMQSFQAEVLIPETVSDDDERRDDLRHEARQHIAIEFRNHRLICDLIDLSECGAKISVLDGIVPNTGEDVTLTLFDGTAIGGRVSWLREKHIGVAFEYPIPDVDERLDFENLGREYFGKAVALQKSTRRS